jgi:hypothetical protein
VHHPIECRAFHHGFDTLSLQAPRPEVPPEQPLEAEPRSLGDTLPCVPTPSPLCRASGRRDLLQDTIAGSGIQVMLCRRGGLQNINVIQALQNLSCPPALPV